jgi:hypothetical protein
MFGGRASRPLAADVSSAAVLPGRMPGRGGRDARPPVCAIEMQLEVA